MTKHMNELLDVLQTNNKCFEKVSDTAIRVSFSGDNIKSINMYVIFSEDDDGEEIMIKVSCWEIMNFEEDKEKGLWACNEANSEIGHLKFYLDEDYDVQADYTIILNAAHEGEDFFMLIEYLASCVDDSYPFFAKAKWSN